MRIWILLSVVVLGLLLGAGISVWQGDLLGSFTGIGKTSDSRIPELPPADGPQPEVVVDNPNFDFGRMERDAHGKHTFVFTNKGDYPLKLAKGDTTCKCTMSDLLNNEVPPGESAEVVLEWDVKAEGSSFAQSAVIFTNDRNHQRVELRVSGTVAMSFKVIPEEITFSTIAPEEEASQAVQIYTSLTDNLQITDYKFDDPKTAEHFSVAWETLPSDQILHDATSACRLVVTAKPGLPYGHFKQTIRVRTSLEDVGEHAIGIEGTVSNGVSLLGGQILNLGTIEKRKGAERQTSLMVRGPLRGNVKFGTPTADPAFVQVEVGEPTEVNNTRLQFPLTIRVPPGSPTVSCLGGPGTPLCKITIPTGVPELGDATVSVQFAIVD